MASVLHLISGDCAGEALRKANLPGDILIWQDILYDGVRAPGWPGEATLRDRAAFLEAHTGGGVTRDQALGGLRSHYETLAGCGTKELVLWFDACLFDQAMLAHVLACLLERELARAKLICVAEFPGIEPFHGLGQLTPEQLASLYPQRQPVLREQFLFAAEADRAFAAQDPVKLRVIEHQANAPLPYLPPAAGRWLRERPDPATGTGRLEQLILAAVADGANTPQEVFRHAAAAETPPQYWGDTTLWAKINGLAGRGLLRIEGPAPRLPQWGRVPEGFRILPA